MNKLVIIDVREPSEYSLSHVSGAISISLSEITRQSAKLNKVSKNSKIIVYCNSGTRSAQAKNLLESYGYTNIENGINQLTIEARQK